VAHVGSASQEIGEMGRRKRIHSAGKGQITVAKSTVVRPLTANLTWTVIWRAWTSSAKKVAHLLAIKLVPDTADHSPASRTRRRN